MEPSGKIIVLVTATVDTKVRPTEGHNGLRVENPKKLVRVNNTVQIRI